MHKTSFLPEIINETNYPNFNNFVESLFSIFCNQFFVEKIKFKGKIVKINQTLLECNQNDNCQSIEYTCQNCPFQGKFERFNHIVTGLNDNTRTPGKYKRNRAIRVHWIKYIIENVNNEKILYFQKGAKHYFWAKEDSYVVILKETKNGQFYLITAFYVDDPTYKHRYENDYRKYQKQCKIEKDSP